VVNLHPTRRINVPDGFSLRKTGVLRSQSSPEIKEIDKLAKSRKLSLLLVLGLALSLGLAASVWAQPMGKGMGPAGPGMMNLTPEQAAKIFDLREKMYADTADLRKQGFVMHAELAALLKAEKPDQNAIQAKQKELEALGDQMQKKMTAFQSEAKKIAPDFDMGMGMGMGPGPGKGMGMGPGSGKDMGKCPVAGEPPPPAK
jgi:Spy/CpxP family protein refolding chaperone